MKKALIAGAASVALAAMPVVGAFAADPATSSTFTDTINVTVKGGCTLENSQQSEAGDYSKSNRTFTKEIAAGTLGYLNADAQGVAAEDAGVVHVSCNTQDSNKAWTVSLVVNGLTGNQATPVTIAGGDDISGPTSAWAIKSNAKITEGTNTFESNDFADYAPAVTNATFLSIKSDKTAEFNPSYRVYIAPDQEPGTYTGTAVYSITLPNA
jgi:hypothetical protein